MNEFNENQRTVISISCSATDVTNCKDIKQQVTADFCALLNSNGGDLVIDFFDQTQTTKDLDQLVRVIEQWLSNLVGAAKMSTSTNLNVASNKIVINVKGCCNLCTVDYNMFLPSYSQINRVLPNEPLDYIQDILFQEEVAASYKFPAIHEEFIQGEALELTETYSVQFKLIEDSPSKSKTLADRICGKGNKIIQCISAFANYRGGAIYIGVDDKHRLIKGEVITEKEKISIVQKVTNKINRMIWLSLQNGPHKGKHWDIHFYPVVDKERTPVKSTFVIVIVVVKCFGGVFLEEPESYHIINGEVERMKLNTWKECLSKRFRGKVSVTCASKSSSQSLCRSPAGRSNWSSKQNRRRYTYLNGIFETMMNNGSWKKFLARAANELASCKEADVILVILAKKIAAKNKQGRFKMAERDLEEYHSLAPESEDPMITEVKEFIMRSAIERCKGNVQESYRHAQNGLAVVEQIPAGTLVVEFFSNIAKVVTILLDLETDLEKKKALREEAISYFKTALEHLEVDKDYMPPVFDQKQKIHINLAFLHLGCSLSASDARAERKVENAAIQEAVKSFNAVDQSINEGYPLSDYRNCQYLLARSMFFCRLSQNLKPDQSEEREIELLNNAIKFSKDARRTAIERNFDEMLQCTTKCINFFTHLLRSNVVD